MTLDVSKLNPSDRAVMSKQATICIGIIGHVAHGKSTVVKGLSGVHTVKFKQEKERNITIKLGYANCKIFKRTVPIEGQPGNYCARGSRQPDVWSDEDGVEWQLVRHISFVDCPGHDVLMATMLNGASVMDGALLLVAANETCPQPQTREHLAAIEIMNLKDAVILQNKVELINQRQAELQMQEIKQFVGPTILANAPIVPISAVLGYNLDVVAEYLVTQIPMPVRDLTSLPQMTVIRSFDVNKPGDSVDDLKGGVVGGSLVKGVLRVGDVVEIRPGHVVKDANGDFTCYPMTTKVTSLNADVSSLEYAVPGSLIGVGTQLDSYFTRADALVGQLLGHPAALPPVFYKIKVKYELLRRLMGVSQKKVAAPAVGTSSADAAAPVVDAAAKQASDAVSKLRMDEMLMLNVGSMCTVATVTALSTTSKLVKFKLANPVCCFPKQKLTISRRIEQHWRLIGHGIIQKGSEVVFGDRQAADDDGNQSDD